MGKIVKVSGPLVVATGMEEANMADVVRVGEQRLIGEILTMTGDSASIQVYEETSGLGPGADVVTTGSPLSVELGPGLVENIYDGIQRPLEVIMERVQGNNLPRGVEVPALDREKKWDFTAVVQPGAQVAGGDIIGTVQETASILHKIMIPPKMRGKLVSIQSGSFTVTEPVAVLEQEDGTQVELPMMQKWPVRVGRPYKHKYPPVVPLQSGQRIVDTFFPVAKGGTAAIPGPFGSGKTVMQHALAKWSDVDLVVYIGCGERGNEMTDVLREFPELVDPVSCIGSDQDRRGSLTAVGAVSPPGGDLSEPVSQATMRIVKVFWALDASLAYRRHFPAINWLNSYSLYLDSLKPWYDEHLGKEFLQNREWAMAVLQEESSLNEIVQLVGKDSLSPKDQITLETAKMIREDFLQQNSFVDIDSYSEYDRQGRLLAMIRQYDMQCRAASERGGDIGALFTIPVREKIGRAKAVPADQYKDTYANLLVEMEEEITAIAEKGEDEL